MLAKAGSFFLLLSLIMGAVYIMSFSALFGKNEFSRKSRKICFVFFNFSIIASYIILLLLFIISDMRVLSVLMHSSHSLDLIYKISASWGSHEASMLFWAFINAVLSIFLAMQIQSANSFAVSLNLFIQICQILYIFFCASPFVMIQTEPKEGFGMNSSLQDVAMTIHPPILFLSYGAFQIIYVLTAEYFVSNVIRNKILSFWSRIAMSALTAAIGLGGWWAYRELGWGGYWFFDPVENISLIVWILSLLFHHKILIKPISSVGQFGFAPFIMIMFGTYLVRSASLTSVHSFAEAKGCILILLFTLILLLFACVVFFLRLANKRSLGVSRNVQTAHQLGLVSHNQFFKYSEYMLIVCALVILLSLFIPIFYGQFLDQEIEILPEFFIQYFVPFILFAFLYSSFSWTETTLDLLYKIMPRGNSVSRIYLLFSGEFYARCGAFLAFLKMPVSFMNQAKALTCPLLVFVLYALSYRYYQDLSVIFYLAYIVAVFIVLNIIALILHQIYNRKFYPKFSGMALGHLSLGLLICSVAYNQQFKITKNVILTPNEEQNIAVFGSIKLMNLEYGKGANYYYQRALVRFTPSRGQEIALFPEMRYYETEKQLSSEVYIKSNILSDWYSVLNNVNNDEIYLQIIYQPGIRLIWISLFLMSAGFLYREISHLIILALRAFK
ncbi:MAG: cytochrome c-type biogenesis CcmF C-terminal domain-containing protein [Rickettsiaceae bacterium]|nr:cytochrome c-type biogenesis CcmF C-terminal domain-containing protein [Rickettsiaceae bacterium]